MMLLAAVLVVNAEDAQYQDVFYSVDDNHLTCLMITHNMQSALELGNRTIMMHHGKIIYDVSGDKRKGLGVSDLLGQFKKAAGKDLDNDRMILV